MAMISTQYLLLSSSGQDPANVTFEVPEDSLTCGNGQFIKLTLVQHSCLNNINNVSTGFNTVTVDSSSWTLPTGSYRIMDSIDVINALQTKVTLSYNASENKMVYQNNTGSSVTLTFQGRLAYLFGLRPWAPTLTISANARVTSGNTIVPQNINELCIHLTGVQFGPPYNIANIANPRPRELSNTTLFGVIPVRAPPGHLSVYSNVTESFQCQLYDTDVQRMVFRVTDIDGNAIDNLSEWTMVLKCDVYNRPSQDPVLGHIKTLVRYAEMWALGRAIQDTAE